MKLSGSTWLFWLSVAIVVVPHYAFFLPTTHRYQRHTILNYVNEDHDDQLVEINLVAGPNEFGKQVFLLNDFDEDEDHEWDRKPNNRQSSCQGHGIQRIVEEMILFVASRVAIRKRLTRFRRKQDPFPLCNKQERLAKENLEETEALDAAYAKKEEDVVDAPLFFAPHPPQTPPPEFLLMETTMATDADIDVHPSAATSAIANNKKMIPETITLAKTSLDKVLTMTPPADDSMPVDLQALDFWSVSVSDLVEHSSNKDQNGDTSQETNAVNNSSVDGCDDDPLEDIDENQGLITLSQMEPSIPYFATRISKETVTPIEKDTTEKEKKEAITDIKAAFEGLAPEIETPVNTDNHLPHAAVLGIPIPGILPLPNPEEVVHAVEGFSKFLFGVAAPIFDTAREYAAHTVEGIWSHYPETKKMDLIVVDTQSIGSNTDFGEIDDVLAQAQLALEAADVARTAPASEEHALGVAISDDSVAIGSSLDFDEIDDVLMQAQAALQVAEVAMN